MTAINLTESLRILSLTLSTTKAVQAEPDASELAKKTRNPIVNLISVPVMNNINFNAGHLANALYGMIVNIDYRSQGLERTGALHV